MADTDKVYDVRVEKLSVPTGASNFLFVKPVPQQFAIFLMPISNASASFEISGGGASYAASGSISGRSASLVAIGSGFPVPSAGIMINGPAQFWLSAGGTSGFISAIRYLSSDNTAI